MASIHAEVPNDVDIEKSHEIIDRIEEMPRDVRSVSCHSYGSGGDER